MLIHAPLFIPQSVKVVVDSLLEPQGHILDSKKRSNLIQKRFALVGLVPILAMRQTRREREEGNAGREERGGRGEEIHEKGGWTERDDDDIGVKRWKKMDQRVHSPIPSSR